MAYKYICWFCVLAAVAARQDCDDPCSVGKHGIHSIMGRLKGHVCGDYASRVIDESMARECGAISLADALRKCAHIGDNMLPQCYKHKPVGVAIVITQNAAAVSIWLPVVWKILQMRSEKLK